MSNGRRHRRRLSRPRPQTCVWVALASDDEVVEEAKRVAHDALVAGLGDRRTSGVSWRLIGASDPAAFELLDDLDARHSHREQIPQTAGPGTELLPGRDYDSLREKMRELPGATLVVATCEGQR